MVILETVRILSISMISFLVVLAVQPFMYRFLQKFKTGKHIQRNSESPIYYSLHQHKEGTPNMAGIMIWGTVIGLALLFLVLGNLVGGIFSYLNFVNRAETYLPLAAMLLAGIFGLLDDVLGNARIGPNGGGIKIRHKLLVYLVLGVIGALWFFFRLDWNVLAVPFFGLVAIGWFYIPYFVFIIVASAFSANEADGLDGLAGGTLLFAFIALTAVAFVLGRYHLAAFSGATIGALLAFLWFNIHPAKFFMGDTGSMSLGVTMGIISLLTNTSLLLPLFAPILVFESLSVIIQLASRRFRGKKVFLSTPIHNHFCAIGWPEARVVMRFWIFSAMTVVLGLVIFFLSQYFVV